MENTVKEGVKAENRDTRVWLETSISQTLVNKAESSKFNEKIQALREEASKIAPNGRLSIFLSSDKEKFYQFEKVVANLVLSKKLYNERNFMRDPELAIEFAAVGGLIKEINRIIDKRKKQGGRGNDRNDRDKKPK